MNKLPEGNQMRLSQQTQSATMREQFTALHTLTITKAFTAGASEVSLT
jgi:hypothetical protein